MSIQSQLQLEVVERLVVYIKYNMAINQITAPLAAELDNSKHFMVSGTIKLLGVIQFAAIIGSWMFTIGFLY